MRQSAHKFWASFVAGGVGLASVFGLGVNPELALLVTALGQAALTYFVPNRPR